MNPPANIRAATFPADLATVRALFREYSAGLGIDLNFQGFEQELATLPGKYAAPAGRVLLAEKDGGPVGCVALRPLDNGDCEMKRLYVRATVRGEQLGRRLAQRICEEARDAGYRRICLDTLDTMQAAQALYHSLGFREIGPYVFNPIPGARYLALELDAMKDLGRHHQA